MTNWNLLFRRAHLYLGLVLLPWVVIYAVSTVYFNHGFGHAHGGGAVAGAEWKTLWEKDHTTAVSEGDDGLRETGRRLMAENGFSGPFGVQRQGPRLVVVMPQFLQPARLIYDTASQKLKAEVRAQSSSREVLARLHTRAGYGRGGALSDVWAVFVDLYCVATFVWILTGLYLWWQLAATRSWGFVALGGGMATIAVLLFAV